MGGGANIGLSLMLEEDFRVAAAPLFADGLVDVLEWSFDTGWRRTIPEWADALLDHYGSEGRLLGHGVSYSPFSAAWEPRQAAWLEDLAREVSEHYGFMTAPPFVRGAPLPVPRCETSLRIGRDRLARMRRVVTTGGTADAIGIENLALAWNRDEALAHGAFLAELLEGTNDFIVLDLHNVYCQLENFGLAPDELLATFPSERVRELHVSGGSFLPAWPHEQTLVRCDTHDERVPPPVFDLLERALVRFPNVEAIVFERLGGTIKTEEEADLFRRDYLRIREIAEGSQSRSSLRSLRSVVTQPETESVEDAELAAFQSALLVLLESGLPEGEIHARLAAEPAFEPNADLARTMDRRALGVAARVVKKYARRG